MDAYEAALNRRSIRRFKRDKVPWTMLEKCVEAARLSPTGTNKQPLEFIIVDDAKKAAEVFSTLTWAALIHPAGHPPAGEEPSAYIVILLNKDISGTTPEYDAAAAAQTICLVAVSEGLGSCMLANIKHESLAKALNIPESRRIVLVIALGYANESPVVEDLTDSFKYYKDEKGVLHVPKRKLADITYHNSYGERV
jgi:nitroreductase